MLRFMVVYAVPIGSTKAYNRVKITRTRLKPFIFKALQPKCPKIAYENAATQKLGRM